MIRLFVLVICLVLCQCKTKVLSVDDLNTFVLDDRNGLIQSTEVNGTKLSVTYRPSDLLIAQEFEDARKDMLDSLKEKYGRNYYFVLSLQHENGEALGKIGDSHAYSHLVKTMSFRMLDHLYLTTANRDTIPVADFMMNRTYGLAASTDVLFVFDRSQVDDCQWFEVNLSEFGLGVGIQRFRFSSKKIAEVPQIDFQL